MLIQVQFTADFGKIKIVFCFVTVIHSYSGLLIQTNYVYKQFNYCFCPWLYFSLAVFFIC